MPFGDKLCRLLGKGCTYKMRMPSWCCDIDGQVSKRAMAFQSRAPKPTGILSITLRTPSVSTWHFTYGFPSFSMGTGTTLVLFFFFEALVRYDRSIDQSSDVVNAYRRVKFAVKWLVAIILFESQPNTKPPQCNPYYKGIRSIPNAVKRNETNHPENHVERVDHSLQCVAASIAYFHVFTCFDKFAQSFFFLWNCRSFCNEPTRSPLRCTVFPCAAVFLRSTTSSHAWKVMDKRKIRVKFMKARICTFCWL